MLIRFFYELIKSLTGNSNPFEMDGVVHVGSFPDKITIVFTVVNYFFFKFFR
jgi:hypothetical protein